MDLEGRCAALWQSMDTGICHLEIDTATPEGKGLALFFLERYLRRDAAYGEPEFSRQEEGSAGKEIFNFTFRDLAQAFMGQMTSPELATYLEGMVREYESQSHMLPTVRALDSFFRYGFVIDESREKGRWEFWRIYAPDFSAKELARMIPSKYKSRSRHDPLAGEDGKVYEDHFSPLLKTSSHFKGPRDLDRKYAGVPAQDAFALGKLRRRGKKTDARDELSVRFLRRWHHPFVLLYSEKQLGCANLFPHGLGASERMASLEEAYPRLRDGPAPKGLFPMILDLASRMGA